MDDLRQHKPTEADTRAELTHLWLKSLPVLETFIRGLIRDRDARDDVLQATAEQVSRQFDEYDRSRPFSAWIIGIARYRVLAHYRDTRRDRLRFNEDAIEMLSNAAGAVSAEWDDRKEALEVCLNKLQPQHRKLICLRYVDDMLPAALAEKIGSTANAVSAMIRRIRLALAQCIEQRLSDGGKQ